MNGSSELEGIRNRNFSEILSVIRKKGACSFSEIELESSAGLTTVKKCVEQGLKDQMILSGDYADSTGGRKAQQFLINPDYQYFLVIITDNNTFICMVYNFARECVWKYDTSFAMNNYINAACSIISNAQHKYPLGTVLLSLPCVIKDGVIIDWYYNRELCGTDILNVLKTRFELNFIIQNDMKLTALGTCEIDRLPSQNIVTAQFGHNGIGVGEIVNGNLLEGATGFAGEVGYINDIKKNIMNAAYIAKIVRSVIICINPHIIVFYKSDRQNDFDKIFSIAVKDLPDYAIPQYIISDNYHSDICNGLFKLVDKTGFFRRRGKNVGR